MKSRHRIRNPERGGKTDDRMLARFLGLIRPQVVAGRESPSCVTETPRNPRKFCDTLQPVRISFATGDVRNMPKAIRFNQLGGPEVLHVEDLPDRQPGPGEVLLKVEAVGVNRAESMYYHGFYMEQVNLPSGLGYEALGKVIAVGPKVDPTLIGKRLATIPGFSMNQYPVLAEEAIVPAGVLTAVPDSFSAI